MSTDNILKLCSKISEMNFERSVLIPAGLCAIAEKTKAVCAIFDKATKELVGTGFRIADDLIITNNHVISSKEAAKKMVAYFDYSELWPEVDPDPLKVEFNVNENQGGFFHTSPCRRKKKSSNKMEPPEAGELDFSIIGLSIPEKQERHPRATLSLFEAEEPQLCSDTYLIQHTIHGEPPIDFQRVTHEPNSVREYTRHTIHYVNSSQEGSSGGPLLTEWAKLIGVNRGDCNEDSHLILDCKNAIAINDILDALPKEILTQIKKRTTPIKPVTLNLQSSPPPPYARNVKLFSLLANRLKRDGQMALTGPSGSGKRSLALQYAHHQNNYRFICFIGCGNKETFQKDIGLLGDILEIPNTGRQTVRYSKIKRRLETTFDTHLLIFDKVNDEQIAKDIFLHILPQKRGEGHYLLTVDDESDSINMDDLKEIKYPLKNLDEKNASALGGSPLVLALATGYINGVKDSTFTTYLRNFKRKSKGLQGSSEQDKKKVRIAWQLIKEALGPQCDDLMTLIAPLAGTPIPRALIDRCMDQVLNSDETISKLIAFACLTEAGNNCFYIHPLLGEAITAKEKDKENSQLIEILDQLFRQKKQEGERVVLETLLPLCGILFATSKNKMPLQLLFDLGLYHMSVDDFAQSEQYFLHLISQLKERDETPTATLKELYYNLAILYHQMREFSQANNYYRKAMNGENQGIIEFQLGILCRDRDRRDKDALTHFNKAEAHFDKESIEYAMVLHEKALLLKKKKKDEEATKLLQEAIAIKKQLGYTNSLILSLHELGNLQRINQQFDVALQTFEEALRAMSSNEPSLNAAIIWHSKGMVLHDQKKYEEAKLAYLKSITIKKKLPGIGKWLEIADSLHQLGLLYHERYVEKRRWGEDDRVLLNEATDAYDKARDIKTQFYGELHETTKLTIDKMETLRTHPKTLPQKRKRFEMYQSVCTEEAIMDHTPKDIVIDSEVQPSPNKKPKRSDSSSDPTFSGASGTTRQGYNRMPQRTNLQFPVSQAIDRLGRLRLGNFVQICREGFNTAQ